MTANSFYQINVCPERTTKQQVYQLLVKAAAPLASKEDQQQLLDLFAAREEAGDSFIAPQIILPHIESVLVSESRICLIHLERPILNWNEKQQAVQLIIAILLKEAEQRAIKEEIRQFVRKLAEDDFLAHLQKVKSQTELSQLIANK
jgi:mannitol/fructose-specific phosphotransferase system IIA component (Ntr-type)